MQLTEDRSHGQYLIRSFNTGKITINEAVYHENLIITPSALICPWTPKDTHHLTEAHIKRIIDLKPQTVIIGSGEQSRHIPSQLLIMFYQLQIGVEVMNTRSACSTFNVLASEGRNVAAGLFLK